MSQSVGSRGVKCGVLCLLAALLLGGWQVAVAQDEKPAEGAPAAAPAGEEGAGYSGTSMDDRKQESFLSWTIRSSGIFGALIGILSFILVALIMMNFLQLRRENILPTDLVEGFEQKLNAKDYQGAYELAKSDESLLARVLTVGLGRLNRGYDEAVEGMQELMDDENMAMEHKLSYIGMIGSIAPMLGLMGTVQGMIMSFRQIATSTTSPKPADLADGISTALFTTIEGLIVAIPAIVAFGFLKNRVSRFMFEIGMVAEGLMSRFAAVGKRPAGGAAPAGAPAAPQQ